MTTLRSLRLRNYLGVFAHKGLLPVNVAKWNGVLAVVVDFDGAGTTKLVVGNMDIPARGTVGSTGVNPADGDTITISSKTYRFKTTPVAINDVNSNVNNATTLANLVKAINQTGIGDGSDYFAGTTQHPDVFAWPVSGNNVPLSANIGGTGGNSIATTKTGTNTAVGGATLASGANGGTAWLTAGIA
jgi:hypothetical protein